MPTERYHWTPEDLVAGELCLEFTNTMGDLGKSREIERLTDWEAYLNWSLAAGALDAAEARELKKTGAGRSAQSRQALRVALELRATLYRALAALAAGRAPDRADFDWIELEIVKAVSSAHLRPSSGAYGWTASEDQTSPRTPITRILLSTLRLLQSPELPLLRECQRCSWLFIDRSKNHGRRWCRAQACGNRARVERHYRAHLM